MELGEDEGGGDSVGVALSEVLGRGEALLPPLGERGGDSVALVEVLPLTEGERDAVAGSVVAMALTLWDSWREAEGALDWMVGFVEREGSALLVVLAL